MGAYLDFKNRLNQADDDQQSVQLGLQQQTPGVGTLPQLPRLNQPGGPQNQKRSPVESWNSVLGDLNNGYNQLDAPGQAKLNDLNLKTESLMAARGTLRPNEFTSAMKSVHDSAIDYPWDSHIKPPGSNPGDIVEEDGIRKLTEADGSRKPIAYTPEYMAKNAMPIGDTGKIAIPVAPDKPYEIVDAKERDLAAERGEIEKAAKGIEKLYTEIAKEQQILMNKEVKDDSGKVIGTLPFTQAERRQMSIMARDAWIKDQLQAKHAAKVVADAGAHELRQAIGGDVADPYQREQEIAETSRDLIMTRHARKEAAAELMQERGIPPTPSPTPVPFGPQEKPWLNQQYWGPPTPPGVQRVNPQPYGPASPEMRDQTLYEQYQTAQGQTGAPPGQPFTPEYQSPEAAAAQLQATRKAAGGGGNLPSDLEKFVQGGTEADVAQSIAKRNEYLKQTSRVTAPDFESRLVQAGMLKNTLQAPSKTDMQEMYADAEDGIVVELPNRQRYVKDDGKFWEIPAQFSYENLRSDVMLDAEGNPVIDPNTGEPAPGTIRQLATGKSGEFRMADEGYTVGGGPTIPYEQEPAAPGVTPTTTQARPQRTPQSPPPAPGEPAAAPSDTKATEEIAAGVEPSRLPQPEANQPAVTAQDAAQARAQQASDVVYKTNPERMRKVLRQLIHAKPQWHRAMLSAPLLAGSAPNDLAPGEAFRTPSGGIFVKLEDGSFEGPFSAAMLQEVRPPALRAYGIMP